ncbi:MAG: glycosyltransferase family 4 protein [Chloroflexi bacterium]|nr:glycosyltransferase family 4 protein [Chloroflexota bacterium]MBI3338920.1 glycosyltransferase family 4 protein [Chloroflexota bacterium]
MKTIFSFQGRLGLQQRVLPAYRVPFFDMLAQSCEGGMSLFAGLPRPSESIAYAKDFRFAKYAVAHNIHLLDGSFYFCYQRGLIAWLTDWNPDALIVEANPRYLATSSAVKWMRSRGRKVIGWGLGAPHLSGPFAGLRQTRRIHFLGQFDALIAYSQRGADEYAALGFPREKIFVAPNAVASKPLSPLPSRPSTFNIQPAILFVGRLQARKRVDFLLRACAELNLKVRLMIVGDGPERENLESLAKRVYQSAEFIGARHGDELKPYFMEADIFVLPGTGGLAVQEAMSYGLPIIVAKGDGTQDDLVRESNGWQIPPEDYAALVSTLRTALSDVNRLRKMGEESFRIVSEEINLEKMVEGFVRTLNSMNVQ